MLYLDHAATSHPKPAEVASAMLDYMALGGNPGRSGHRLSQESEVLIWNAREMVATFFGTAHPSRVVFTLNATMALNMAIAGLVEPGERILTSGFEHNSVARPVKGLTRQGIGWTVIGGTACDPVDLEQMETELKAGDVRLVVLCHASNVTGAVAPMKEISALCADHGALLLVDASQTAGHLPVTCGPADIVAFAGHKGLLGPQGVGGLVLGEHVGQVRPLVRGGSGGRSELLDHPRSLPSALEAGTPNGVGIAGLRAGLQHVTNVGLDTISRQERRLRQAFVAGLENGDRPLMCEWPSSSGHAAVVSVQIPGLHSSTAAALLEERYQILVRGGMHCAALAHQSLKTSDAGTVRVSFSHRNSIEEARQAASAVLELAYESE